MGLGLVDLDNLTLDGLDINSIPSDELSIGSYLSKLKKPKRIIASRVARPAKKIFVPPAMPNITSIPDYNVPASAFGVNSSTMQSVGSNGVAHIVRPVVKGSNGTSLKHTGTGRDDGWVNDPANNAHMIIPQDIDYSPVDPHPAYVKPKDNFVPYSPVDPHPAYVKPKDNFVPYSPVDPHPARVTKKVAKQVKALNTKAQSAPVKSDKAVKSAPVKKTVTKERAEAIKSLTKKRSAKKTTVNTVRKKTTAKKTVRKPSVARKAPAKRFATVDPLNIFGNKNGVNPFNPKNKGSNRFSGGKVTSAKTKKRKLSVDQALDLF